jgi:hypothetical protein
MHKGSYTDNSLLQSVSVRDPLQRYLTDETPKKKGAESEAWRLLAFMRQPFADLSLMEIDSNAISKWRDERLKVVRSATVRRDLILLSHPTASSSASAASTALARPRSAICGTWWPRRRARAMSIASCLKSWSRRDRHSAAR